MRGGTNSRRRTFHQADIPACGVAGRLECQRARLLAVDHAGMGSCARADTRACWAARRRGCKSAGILSCEHAKTWFKGRRSRSRVQFYCKALNHAGGEAISVDCGHASMPACSLKLRIFRASDRSGRILMRRIMRWRSAIEQIDRGTKGEGDIW